MARAIFVVMLLGVGLAAAVPQRWGSSTDPSDPAGVVGHITYEPDTAPLTNSDVSRSMDDDEATLSELGADVQHLRSADSYLFSSFARGGKPGPPGRRGPPGAPGVASAPPVPEPAPAAAMRARRAQQLLRNYASDAGELRHRLKTMVHTVRAAAGQVGAGAAHESRRVMARAPPHG
ncbi:hypothetical protein T484DRAFT_1942511 [Baffinella frigidus]|nr:hypothetical protein T484DRAFT_1942511 [Cryptophyta sp. CCMP2293]